jgi:3-polyprenyl-4-hydroxybenzoate decarboxylase
MIHTIETLKELHEQRFVAVEKAITLAAEEVARRLEVLNHFHQLAREKERDFIGREAYETFAQRITHDLGSLRRENQAVADASTAAREVVVKGMSDRLLEQTAATEIRFGKMEAVHSKIVGGLVLGTFILPLITGMVIYILTKSQ